MNSTIKTICYTFIGEVWGPKSEVWGPKSEKWGLICELTGEIYAPINLTYGKDDAGGRRQGL